MGMTAAPAAHTQAVRLCAGPQGAPSSSCIAANGLSRRRLPPGPQPQQPAGLALRPDAASAAGAAGAAGVAARWRQGRARPVGTTATSSPSPQCRSAPRCAPAGAAGSRAAAGLAGARAGRSTRAPGCALTAADAARCAAGRRRTNPRPPHHVAVLHARRQDAVGRLGVALGHELRKVVGDLAGGQRMGAPHREALGVARSNRRPALRQAQPGWGRWVAAGGGSRRSGSGWDQPVPGAQRKAEECAQS